MKICIRVSMNYLFVKKSRYPRISLNESVMIHSRGSLIRENMKAPLYEPQVRERIKIRSHGLLSRESIEIRSYNISGCVMIRLHESKVRESIKIRSYLDV